jgi:excisionase family DNA binding protein
MSVSTGVNSVETPRFWKLAPLAEAANVSRPTLYRLIQDGRLRAIKVRGTWRIPLEDAEALLRGEL